MAGGNHNTGVAAELPHGEGQNRHRLKLLHDSGGYAVGGQHPGALSGEQLRFDPAVVGDGHGGPLLFGVKVVSQALGSAADGINIHTIGARADYPSQARGTEFKFFVKTVVDFLFIAGNPF